MIEEEIVIRDLQEEEDYESH